MKQHRFNWVDGLVILVILGLIAGTFVKFYLLRPVEIQQETVEIEYTIRITGVRQYSVDALQVGDTVYDDDSKTNLGTISAIQTETARKFVSFPDGTTRPVDIQDRFDILLTVRADAVFDGGFYKIKTCAVKPNQTTSFFTKYLAWSGRVLSVGEVEA